jgi:hypothetical protein
VFHGGIDSVPNTGFALLEQGERVISRSRNSGGDDVMAEVRDELRAFREQALSGTRAVIASNAAVNDQAADKIVDGTSKAASRAAWLQANANEAKAFA